MRLIVHKLRSDSEMPFTGVLLYIASPSPIHGQPMLNTLSSDTQASLPTHLRDPREVLAWAERCFPRGLVVASALGPQSIVAIHLAVQQGLVFDVVLLDTGMLFDETLALADRLERRLGVSIERVRPEPLAAKQAEGLWQDDPAECCRLRKVEPLARRLGSASAWMTGLRRTLTRAEVQSVEWDATHGLVKINPLAWWTRERVLEHLAQHDLPYNPLLDEGYASVGCHPCTSPVEPGEDERAGRWRGRAKTECGIHHRLIAAGTVAANNTKSLS